MYKKKFGHIIINSGLQRILMSIVGIAVNVSLVYIMHKLGFSLYLDTIGTLVVSGVGGLFPGILTAVITNVLCSSFDPGYAYFGFINATFAISFVWFLRKFSYKKLKHLLIYTLTVAVCTGSISAAMNWYMLSGVQSARNSDTVQLIQSSTGIPLFWTFFFYCIILGILDKGISVAIAWLVLILVPNKYLEEIEKGNWKQAPLSSEDIDTLKVWSKDIAHPMRARSTVIIISTSLLLVLVMGWIGLSLYFKNAREEKTIDALASLRLSAEIIDPTRINDYINKGRDALGYEDTARLLKNIRDNYMAVDDMYFLAIGESAARLVFDLDATSADEDRAGEKIEYSEELQPYIQDLLAGHNISPVESGNMSNWTRSVYYPIFDNKGKCVCYGVAVISLTEMSQYLRDFAIKSSFILFGFFILVISHNLWITNVTMVYPIRSMAKCVDDFSNGSYEQEQLDANVRNIRALDIKTNDEVQKLYESICRLTLKISEQMRDLRRLSDTTAKMQDGLIVTMADMVENRDSDTGEHIQKTAAYVSVIVNGLKQKGYYAEKITPKFVSDVVRSAPLHDIGKINIPDGILNKPGKLTDEEYEIMKTHTTAGKKIMENAISTVRGENYLKEARNMAAYHHERWDGKGYPEGLHGEVIPLSARIMAVADVFDALTSPRVYKPAFPIEKALTIITEGSGTQFDPKCVEVFMDSLPEVKVILRKYNKDV